MFIEEYAPEGGWKVKLANPAFIPPSIITPHLKFVDDRDSEKQAIIFRELDGWVFAVSWNGGKLFTRDYVWPSEVMIKMATFLSNKDVGEETRPG